MSNCAANARRKASQMKTNLGNEVGEDGGSFGFGIVLLAMMECS